MNNSTNNSVISVSNSDSRIPPLTVFIGCLNLIIIGLGLVGNTTSFLIFRFHQSFKTMPSMVYLSFVAVTDTIALFEWSLNHFRQLVYGLDLVALSGCRYLEFLQYTSLQSSGMLLSVMCIDRFVTVMSMPGSFLHRLPFRTVKTAFIWSFAVVSFCFLLNFHLLFTSGKDLLFKFWIL